MPESKSRKKPVTPAVPKAAEAPQGNPRWLIPTMVTLLVVGLLWVVVTYLTAPTYWPVPPLERWNILVGFVLMLGGMILAMRWR